MFAFAGPTMSSAAHSTTNSPQAMRGFGGTSPAAEIAALSAVHRSGGGAPIELDPVDLRSARPSRGSRLSSGSASAFVPQQRQSTATTSSSSPPLDELTEYSSPIGAGDAAWLPMSGRVTPAHVDTEPPSPRYTSIPGTAGRVDRVALQPVPVVGTCAALPPPGYLEALDDARQESEELRGLEARKHELDLRLRDCENDVMVYAVHREAAELAASIDRTRREHHHELLNCMERGVRC